MSNDQLYAKQIEEAFQMFDRDNNGVITLDELVAFLGKIYPDVGQELHYIIGPIDLNGNGAIELEEFKGFMSQPMTDEELYEAFVRLDTKNDGYISLDELINIMVTLGENMSHEDAQIMIQHADTNGDGRVDYKEFFNIMRSFEQNHNIR